MTKFTIKYETTATKMVEYAYNVFQLDQVLERLQNNKHVILNSINISSENIDHNITPSGLRENDYSKEVREREEEFLRFQAGYRDEIK